MRIALPRLARIPAGASRAAHPRRDAKTTPRAPGEGKRRNRLHTLRRAVTGGAVLAALFTAAYFLWLRDSPLVAVERTTVTGLTTPEASRVREALAEAASGMTTLNVDVERLEQAVTDYPVVAELQVEVDLPDRLDIEVVEHPAIATVPGADGKPVAVAAGGLLLPDVEVERSLTELPVGAPVTGPRLSDEDGLEALAAVEAVDPALAKRVVRVERSASAGGLVATMRQGPEVRLGAASDLERKWAAATAVLAHGDLADTGYLDVSLPARPVLGG